MSRTFASLFQILRPHVSISENMATQRVNTLLSLLPDALETGLSEIDAEIVPLKVGHA